MRNPRGDQRAGPICPRAATSTPALRDLDVPLLYSSRAFICTYYCDMTPTASHFQHEPLKPRDPDHDFDSAPRTRTRRTVAAGERLSSSQGTSGRAAPLRSGAGCRRVSQLLQHVRVDGLLEACYAPLVFVAQNDASCCARGRGNVVLPM